MGTRGALRILLVEDNDDDAILVERSLRRTGFKGELRIVITAEDAIDYLKPSAGEVEPLLPDLIVLDLKLPGMSGQDFLRWIRAEPYLAMIPVIVLSSSPYWRDVSSSYELGAKTFFVKPLTPEELDKLATSIVSYWAASARENESDHDTSAGLQALRSQGRLRRSRRSA